MHGASTSLAQNKEGCCAVYVPWTASICADVLPNVKTPLMNQVQGDEVENLQLWNNSPTVRGTMSVDGILKMWHDGKEAVNDPFTIVTFSSTNPRIRKAVSKVVNSYKLRLMHLK